ncbi:unnamed protein product [Hermetia illucens]|uniref:PIN domain-containing protein n=1 Tax=Hermetia illucens TaxID=343691 RepID=A0A7R8UST4_HERIL|nr:protein SMG5 [Hermetia illucens]CAD7086352.1 unnamed protein product [Hermetia illucens]
MEPSSSDPKETYRIIYNIAKELDDLKKSANNIPQLFDSSVENKRQELVERCTKLLFVYNESIGKKTREILWRKGFYDFIALSKKFYHCKDTENAENDKESQQLAMTRNREKIRDFIFDGIRSYKHIAIKIEELYDLDLQYLIDFTIIKDEDDSLKAVKGSNPNQVANGHSVADKSLEAISYALDIVHSSFLSLGDLHRYFIDFHLDKTLITKEMTARFYFEAFKLNPTIGMAQNQLGTLFYGQNYDLDSIYHYLYSLICTVPFDLSENNVCRLLLAHVDYLEGLDPDKVEFSLRDFYARFYLIVDIFFFDKDVPDFNSLCHCVLIDLRKILCSNSINIAEGCLFKIVCILLFCLSKLKMINSQKVYSLNAFLVAVCSDLIDASIVNLEQYILTKSKQNAKFEEEYAEAFNKFEAVVRKSREDYKLYQERIEPNNRSTLSSHNKSATTDSEGRSQLSDVHDKLAVNNQHNKNNATRSSDEAKESDLKTPLSTKSKRRKMRRRRKRFQHSDESSCYDSESDYDTDLSSNEDQNDDYSDLSSNFESDFSDIEDDEGIKPERDDEGLEDEGKQTTFSENEDIVIEEESIIYPNGRETPDLLNGIAQISITSAPLNFKSDSEEDKNLRNGENGEDLPLEPPVKLKYRNKYSKIDPNIIIDFAQKESTMRCLKILFDWLRINHEILFGCYHSNPEFIHKIMKLLNYCNIDIFTRKVYFDRGFIKSPNVRQDLDQLFEIRSTIPLSEDAILKNFDLLQNTQIPLDWELTIREGITKNEENIMRIFKMVDFGFFICKMKKFNYNFCAKTRRFTENLRKKREKKKSSRRRERRAKNGRKREGQVRRFSERRNSTRKGYTSNEEKDTVEETRSTSIPIQRKGYLRNRNQNSESKTMTSSGGDDERTSSLAGNKCEIMGQLWLRNEVETLETKMKKKPMNVILTPYIVVDTKSLTEYTNIVKNLVKTKKFIVLIPNAVLSELDELKKNSDRARNVIRWLEQEFRRGNRHMRSQRDNESQSLSFLKIPKKLDRDATCFLQIVKFCNYIVTHHSDGIEHDANVLTYLSGDSLHEKCIPNFSYTGILETIPVRFDQVANFYDKYKKK